LLLDAAAAAWHERVREDTDLGELLAEAYGIDLDQALVAEAPARSASYDGAVLEAFETARETRRVKQQADFRTRFIDRPVLTLPVDEQFGYSFNPNGVDAFDGVGQVLTTAEVRGGWGTLEVLGGVLLQRDGRGVFAVVVVAPADPQARPLSGDGWTLTLADGWQLAEGERDGDWVVVLR
jgi:hypothetical protein